VSAPDASTQTTPAESPLVAVNTSLREAGLQDVNARYMDAQTFDRLVSNIRRDGRLESVPLVGRRPNDARFDIISGHHRVAAAKKAGLKTILVMVIAVKNRSELRAKQLSHNAITGKDDDALLKKLYESIEDLEMKMYSGLQDQLDGMAFVSLSFRAGTYKEFVLAFVPEDIETFDAAAKVIADESTIGSGSLVRLTPAKAFEAFAEALRKLKKAENIKANGAALSRMVELATERLAQLMEREAKAKDAAAQPTLAGN
jgi:hypothetical protein